jgi:hypothetical protein
MFQSASQPSRAKGHQRDDLTPGLREFHHFLEAVFTIHKAEFSEQFRDVFAPNSNMRKSAPSKQNAGPNAT